MRATVTVHCYTKGRVRAAGCVEILAQMNAVWGCGRACAWQPGGRRAVAPPSKSLVSRRG